MRAAKDICKQVRSSLLKGYWVSQHAYEQRVRSGETGLDPWEHGGANYYISPSLPQAIDDIRWEKGYGTHTTIAICEIACDLVGVDYPWRRDFDDCAFQSLHAWEVAPERRWSDITQVLDRIIELDPRLGGAKTRIVFDRR